MPSGNSGRPASGRQKGDFVSRKSERAGGGGGYGGETSDTSDIIPNYVAHVIWQFADKSNAYRWLGG